MDAGARAALVFLVLYTILFVFLLFGYATRRLPVRSRYSIIAGHVALRLAAQAVGLAFGLVIDYNSNKAIGLLVAYFALGTEGYFTLVLCAYRFLASWQSHNFECHDSWLEPRHPPNTPLSQRFRDSFVVFGPNRRPMAIMHHLLIIANVLIIVGGVLLADTKNAINYFKFLSAAKITRTVGQVVYLTCNVLLLFCILHSMRQYRRENPERKIHLTLYLLFVAWPLLFVRGTYGIISCVYNPFNYFYFGNYGIHGPKDEFVISEYLLATTMEWTSCCLLMLTYVASRNDPPKLPPKSWGTEEKELSAVVQ
ncbi:hypothetical protein C0991_010705 [Blastosporella zonata]|nr:hypothetical protein C0991_010705 [Blastosporella zonata]